MSGIVENLVFLQKVTLKREVYAFNGTVTEDAENVNVPELKSGLMKYIEGEKDLKEYMNYFGDKPELGMLKEHILKIEFNTLFKENDNYYIKIIVSSDKELTLDEVNIFQTYLEGQMMDGWGEGFSQYELYSDEDMNYEVWDDEEQKFVSEACDYGVYAEVECGGLQLVEREKNEVTKILEEEQVVVNKEVRHHRSR